MISAVFDCVVFIQAILSRKGPAFACLTLVEEKHVTLYLSEPILDELNRTLGNVDLRKRYPALDDGRIETFIKRVAAAGTFVDTPSAASHSSEIRKMNLISIWR